MCAECFPKLTKKTEHVGHKNSQGEFLSCCNSKIKRASQRYPLHAEFLLKTQGISAEEYDKLALAKEKE